MGLKIFYLLCYIFLDFLSQTNCYRNVAYERCKLLAVPRGKKLYNSLEPLAQSASLEVRRGPSAERGAELALKGEAGGAGEPAPWERFKILSKVNGVGDLKRVPVELLPALCQELREFLGEVLGRVGGHFSGSLGVVELSVALHYVFDSPLDRVVWDIGHQAYVHKVLTGRRDRLASIKRKGGLSGFCRIYESEHDVFGAGHSSTSVSSLQGLLEGHQIANSDGNGERRNFICVIGDGGMTGGMAYEALNHAVNIKSPLVLIYNDNGQVSLPTGMESFSGTDPVVPFFFNKYSKRPLTSAKKALEDFLSNYSASEDFLDNEGFRNESELNVIGPIDGHDLDGLLYLFNKIKNPTPTKFNLDDNKQRKDGMDNSRCLQIGDRTIEGPLIIHLKTVKGYCCPEAMEKLDRMHSITPNTKLTILHPNQFHFNNHNSNKEELNLKRNVEKDEKKEINYEIFDNGTFTNVFSNTLIKMAESDKKIAAVTAAMPGGTGVGEFGRFFPKRTFDVGISEQHAVTFSAGLALAGLRPFCCIYSTFLQRALDQLIHDVALQNIPVKFVIDRAGLVGQDGLSHHGNFDLNFLRPLRNFTVMVPSNQIELVSMLSFSNHLKNPSAIRFPKSKVIHPSKLHYYSNHLYNYFKYYSFLQDEENGKGMEKNELVRSEYNDLMEEIKNYKAKVVRKGSKVAVLCLGPILYDVLQALENLKLDATVVDMRFLNPLDTALLDQLERDHQFLVTAEDSLFGGLGASVLEYLSDRNKLSCFQVKCIRYPYEFIHHATIQEQRELAQVDAKGIEKQLVQFLNL